MKLKLKELQRVIDKSIMMVEDFNTALSVTDRTSRQGYSKFGHRIIKNVVELNSTNSQLYLIDIYKTLYSKQQDTCSSQVHTE